MKIVIEFYRTRHRDNAHAVVGRETDEAVDLDDAIRIARSLSATLDMPQRPDAVTIIDAAGGTIYSGALEPALITEGRPTS
ncbi:hypothetical protein ACSBOB_21265 [Mesorhizobium sp. ASY16-5R]|uniref:hypothetical protein n=1 Tax=Mesorhizobium sp. ASY16-5R TaxID=3445772 RepID=UPI003F9FC598